MKSSDHVRKARKESQFFRVIAKLFSPILLDEPQLREIFVNRVELSADGGLCYVFFYSERGEAYFDEQLPHLIVYKPSLRASVAQEIRGRYTPDIIFRFDTKFKKQQRIEELINQVAHEKQPSE